MIILADRFDADKIIEEEKQNWVISILLELGMKEEELSKDSYESRDCMHKNNIEVMTNANGTIEITKDHKIVGKWYEPILTLKMDENNKLYYEIQLICDSIIDNKIV